MYILSTDQGQAVGRRGSPVRQAAIKAGLPPNIPCTTNDMALWDESYKTILTHNGILASSYKPCCCRRYGKYT
ncbi:hypothetical protein [Coxiella-like endosymbiont]|uniref:hypothetical protein n=1 Tax=Coxiella-like endosymbiont TaxID=1592897 RepID=UPI00272D3816|nr:hypothetical protein [Coxiella-like endosymbiont]